CLFFFSTHWLNPYKGMGFRLVVTPPGIKQTVVIVSNNPEVHDYLRGKSQCNLIHNSNAN
ncbi:hypothetical protein, partial [Microcoleus sp. D3_18_C4]|uniref:hypothetical protein n=1 Tax=Microcoleus sp. D3_18_C4 TaxID=3055335 RepID=UPI002FD0F673